MLWRGFILNIGSKNESKEGDYEEGNSKGDEII